MKLMRDRVLPEIHKKLASCGKTVAVAESCSGGLLSAELTRNPGASAYFLLGVTSYSNSSKRSILKIPAGLICSYGAVSPQVAVSMAKAIRKIAKADFGIGITGIAGPSGATPGKPVGTVFICLSLKKTDICRKFFFRGSRNEIRRKTVREALRLLCAHL
ncbi:MAG: CinA family protein [Candidatus Omnitrophica bacterium]|nr:CinA family protein [Candidatus Omnitrophota bacterium]MDD5770677.1 CinA family protein [Candidatus Omnitrophota bacterium]